MRLEEIRIGSNNPRRVQDVSDLVRSIREQGLLQPVLVRPLPEGGYQVVAGERRVRAAREAGLEEVPALVVEADDAEAYLMALAENAARSDMHPLEKAEAFLKAVALRAGKGREEVLEAARRLRSLLGNYGRDWLERARSEPLFPAFAEVSEAAGIGLTYFLKRLYPFLLIPEERRALYLEAKPPAASIWAMEKDPELFRAFAERYREAKGAVVGLTGGKGERTAELAAAQAALTAVRRARGKRSSGLARRIAGVERALERLLDRADLPEEAAGLLEEALERIRRAAWTASSGVSSA